MGDSSTTKALYTPTPIDLAIPRCENDFISVEQNAVSITPHATNAWIQTGTGGGATAQVFFQASTVANKRLFLQNSLAPGAGSLNEVKVTRSGVYKIVYSAEIEFTLGEGAAAVDVELGVGFSSTVGTAIVNNLPTERVVRLQPPTAQTSGDVNEHVTGSVVLRLPGDTVIRFYDRTLVDAVAVTILNADVTIQRLGRDGQ